MQTEARIASFTLASQYRTWAVASQHATLARIMRGIPGYEPRQDIAIFLAPLLPGEIPRT